ncbi:unnamed protein product [Boreogadus saida]
MFGRLATPRSDVIALPAVICSAHSAEAGRRLTVSAIISHRIRQTTHISQKKKTETSSAARSQCLHDDLRTRAVATTTRLTEEETSVAWGSSVLVF